VTHGQRLGRSEHGAHPGTQACRTDNHQQQGRLRTTIVTGEGSWR
jgi:hypothetical protein